MEELWEELPSSQELDPLGQLLAEHLDVRYGKVENWGQHLAGVLREAGYLHRDEVLADPTAVGMEKVGIFYRHRDSPTRTQLYRVPE